MKTPQRSAAPRGRDWLVVLLSTALSAGVIPCGPPDPVSVCVGETLTLQETTSFVASAIEVLEACGHDPFAYRVELSQDDPFMLAGPERKPVVTATFLPTHPGPLYPVAVSPTEPCVVSWIAQPAGLTSWQRDLLERVRRQVQATHPEWTQPDRWDLQVTETREHVGVRIRPATATSPASKELRVLLDKQSLRIVALEASERSMESEMAE